MPISLSPGISAPNKISTVKGITLGTGVSRTGTVTPPPVSGSYVAEDGVSQYVTEDGLNNYVTET